MKGLAPIAWLLTWTTYGTWLHGDARGSWDAQAHGLGARFVAPNIRLQALRRSQLRHDPVLLSAPMRAATRRAIESDCSFRNWPLLAVHVRTNHVHVVVANAAPATKMLHALKAHATRKLRGAGLVPQDHAVWTARGSMTWLMDELETRTAVQYVIHEQGEPLPEA